jgi:putative ABC transport system ATP-binding protein/macrolide transport system ATP-binding/permease protein/lipoprotein-releasing system ATP-binding protein
MLEARGLHKVYTAGRSRVAAVIDVSLRVEPGEFLAVCGRSGSGKSTLLALLGGLCRPSRGAVIQDGVEVWSLAAGALAEFRNRHVGFVFQFASLLPTLRAVDNVALPALVGGANDLVSAYTRAEALLRQVGLHHRRDAYPAELSGGEQRRVALARALINRPPLLLADEPTGDLDEETEVEIFELLLDLRRRQPTTLLVVTHNPAIARQADRVLHLQHGRLVSTVLAERPLPEGAKALPPDPGQNETAAAAPAPAAEPAAAPVPLGAGLGRFLSGFAAWAALVVLGILVLDYGIASLQHRSLVSKETARKKLEEAALKQLQADVENLAYGPDGSYLLTLYLQNTVSERDLFVLAPSVRVYVQVGRDWEEVPSRSSDQQEGRVIRLTDRHRFEFVFRPKVKQFEEQIAGYMHVRVSNALLISTSSEPKDDLVERTDAYYVYLKPHHADDAEILRRNKWSGKPPLWIPMPPH